MPKVGGLKMNEKEKGEKVSQAPAFVWLQLPECDQQLPPPLALPALPSHGGLCSQGMRRNHLSSFSCLCQAFLSHNRRHNQDATYKQSKDINSNGYWSPMVMAALFIITWVSVSAHMSINRGTDGQWDIPISHYCHPVLILVRGLTF